MNYEEWLMHFNPNHDPSNGQFTSSKDAKIIVKNTRKAMKNGVYSDKSRKYREDIKSRVNDEELNRLVEKSEKLFLEFRDAHMDWRRGLISEKKMNTIYNKYQTAADAKFKRSSDIAKNICNSIGIQDAELERKLTLILR